MDEERGNAAWVLVQHPEAATLRHIMLVYFGGMYQRTRGLLYQEWSDSDAEPVEQHAAPAPATGTQLRAAADAVAAATAGAGPITQLLARDAVAASRQRQREAAQAAVAAAEATVAAALGRDGCLLPNARGNAAGGAAAAAAAAAGAAAGGATAPAAVKRAQQTRADSLEDFDAEDSDDFYRDQHMRQRRRMRLSDPVARCTMAAYYAAVRDARKKHLAVAALADIVPMFQDDCLARLVELEDGGAAVDWRLVAAGNEEALRPEEYQPPVHWGDSSSEKGC